MDSHPIFRGLSPVAGFHELEMDIRGSFIWARKNFSLKLQDPAGQFLFLHICYYGDEGKLSIKSGGGASKEIGLRRGWNRYTCELPPRENDILEFEVSKLVLVPGDSRELGLMIRRIEGLSGRDQFDSCNSFISNQALNEQEFLAGKTVLQSYPTHLRIDIESRCNIKPPCVYCEWDWFKLNKTSLPLEFDTKFLEKFGRFYACADELVDCGHGEPLLCRDLNNVINRIVQDGKHLEITINGLLLSEEKHSYFLGKNMNLYVSLDASNALTYARLRTDKFNQLVNNLKSFCKNKKLHNNLPIVIITFLAMRSNVREFPDLLDLVKEIGVDFVKFRSLGVEGYVKDNVTREGIQFDYRNELLGYQELLIFSGSARELAKQKGVNLILEEDFVDVSRRQNVPLCSEPWQSVYLLKRGMAACCFGRQTVTTINAPTRELEDYAREVFNNQAFQTIRAALARRELADYCLKTPSCPIVKKAGCQRLKILREEMR